MKRRRLKSKKNTRYSFLPILTGSDLSARRLPMMETRGKEPGPVVWITGCIHGDEVGGIVVIQEVFKHLAANPLLKGTVHALPLMNPIGFENVTRHLTVTHEDLNRVFPGRKDGSLAERTAHIIFSTIEKTSPSLVIDLHNDWNNSIPYTLTDPYPGLARRTAYRETQRLAHATGFAVINEEESPDDRDDLRHSLSGSMLSHGVPSFTIELGPAYVVKEEFVALGVKSILNVLCELGMLPECERFVYPTPRQFDDKVLRYTHEPRASKSGVVRFIAKPGAAVKKGDILARIYNPFGRLEETILAPRDALILGHTDYSVAFPGMELYAFGYSS